MSSEVKPITEVQPLPQPVRDKMEALRIALLEKNPGYSTVLNDLYKETFKNPEYVYALNDDEMHLFFAGLEQFQNLTVDVPKKMTKAAAASLTEDSV